MSHRESRSGNRFSCTLSVRWRRTSCKHQTERRIAARQGKSLLIPSARGLLVIALLAAGAATVGTSAHAQNPTASARGAGLANPASQNCVDKGGKVTIEKNGKGDQFGVCTFPDNLQCEEWAMVRGDCREGGIRVTGYVTPASRYRAITGGAYKITAGSNTAKEQGTCTFKNGKSCKSTAYFDGTCSRESSARVAG